MNISNSILGLHVTSQKISNIDVAKLWLLYGLELCCYTYSDKVWAENSVLFESSRGLSYFITDHYHNASLAGHKKFVHIEMFNAVENTRKLLLV